MKKNSTIFRSISKPELRICFTVMSCPAWIASKTVRSLDSCSSCFFRISESFFFSSSFFSLSIRSRSAFSLSFFSRVPSKISITDPYFLSFAISRAVLPAPFYGESNQFKLYPLCWLLWIINSQQRRNDQTMHPTSKATIN
jgi:hypothetical protein